MPSFLIGAIIGGAIGLLTVLLIYSSREQRYNKILLGITEPVSYAALYYYSSFKRFKHSLKFFDSFGALYITGDTLCYKTSEAGQPISFNLKECKVQDEGSWRWLKWLSVTTPAGEKFYFNSHKMGFFKNNNEETTRGLAAIKAKQTY